jgi:hypothetical protein
MSARRSASLPPPHASCLSCLSYPGQGVRENEPA